MIKTLSDIDFVPEERDLNGQMLSLRGISLMIKAFRKAETNGSIDYNQSDYRESWRRCIDVLHSVENMTQAIDTNIGSIIDRCNTKLMTLEMDLIDVEDA